MMVKASAPAKAILFGEHAVNRGQSALAVSVGLHVTCELETGDGDQYRFVAGARDQTVSRSDVLELGARVDAWRAVEDFSSVRDLVRGDYFAPAKYLLAGLGQSLPSSLTVRWSGEIPPSGGLGSGGAAFAVLAAAVLGTPSSTQIKNSVLDGVSLERTARLAWRGDVVAHGGIASGLDTGTSVYGGAIRYTLERWAEPVPCAPGLMLVIGDTGKPGATAEANTRVRQWLEERPSRMHHFEEVGLLSKLAEPVLERGDWVTLGHLMNLSQLLLERISVSTPDLERLIAASLEAGALGAKLSGSGGGGIMLALVTPDSLETVKHAISSAGGTAIHAPVGVPGVQVELESTVGA
jgi:mevalonate kinase